MVTTEWVSNINRVDIANWVIVAKNKLRKLLVQNAWKHRKHSWFPDIEEEDADTTKNTSNYDKTEFWEKWLVSEGIINSTSELNMDNILNI